jgi:hypothetical protein
MSELIWKTRTLCIQTILDRIATFYNEIMTYNAGYRSPEGTCLVRVSGELTRSLFRHNIKLGLTTAEDFDEESLDEFIKRLQDQEAFHNCEDYKRWKDKSICVVCKSFSNQRWRTLVNDDLPIKSCLDRSQLMEHVRDQARKCNTARWVGEVDRPSTGTHSSRSRYSTESPSS